MSLQLSTEQLIKTTRPQICAFNKVTLTMTFMFDLFQLEWA